MAATNRDFGKFPPQVWGMENFGAAKADGTHAKKREKMETREMQVECRLHVFAKCPR